MSLWNKRLSEIDFSNLDEFCKAGWAEGVQLDYKREIPKDLSKLAAAFANTRGGLILLGVEADKTTNKPKDWPCKGMKSEPGLSERILQTCRDGIHPPLLPEISPIIEDPNNSDCVFLVVRIRESPRAPHALQNGTKVYIRTGDTIDPTDLSDIHRIEHLLQRRQELDREREALLDRHLTRFNSRQSLDYGPTFWWFAAPEFPYEDLCAPDCCSLGVMGSGQNKAPDGYIRFKLYTDSKPADFELSGAGKQGDIIFAKQFNRRKNESDEHPYLTSEYIENLTATFLTHIQAFYNRDEVSYPGLLRITLGGCHLINFSLVASDIHRGEPFVDDRIRIDRTLPLEEITHKESRLSLGYHMMEELYHGFGLGKPRPASFWRILPI